ncbi:HI1506-related protein [Marinobacter subterrani]|uniref:Mu-like prophage FluMu N-terminal domain-containing protein n=1 Tax=Marinobacter subterrani TaxID=1658765 RepID=A0A0J7J777_9GAMM|nr:HI1506-related protein [Marinobacter subterrani]KMQ74007.1 hypothetical protein Msub_10178 [Marinobacter subterrani]
MAATKTSKARSTKQVTQASKDTAADTDNTQIQDTAKPEEVTQGQGEQSQGETPAQDTAGSDQGSPADGGNSGDTKDPEAQPKAGDQEKSSASEEVKRIAVRSITPSFRRAGFQFGRTETILDIRRLTDEQLQAIEEEPRLVVRPVTADSGQEG